MTPTVVGGRARLATEMRSGRSRLSENRASPPLTFRSVPTTDGICEVQWVGTTAGPLGGDDLTLNIDVGDGSHLRIGSTGASMVQPGPDRSMSVQRTDISIGEDAELCWQPEPTVLVDGCDHRSTIVVHLAVTARFTFVEEVVFGRHGEPSGTLSSSLSVVVGGSPVVRNGFDSGAPGWSGAGGIGAARYAAQFVLIGADCTPGPPQQREGARSATTTLPGGGVLGTVVAHQVSAGRALTADLLRSCQRGAGAVAVSSREHHLSGE